MGRFAGQPSERAELAEGLVPHLGSIRRQTEQLADSGSARRQLLGFEQLVASQAIPTVREGVGGGVEDVERWGEPVLASDAPDLLAEPLGQIIGAAFYMQGAPPFRVLVTMVVTLCTASALLLITVSLMTGVAPPVWSSALSGRWLASAISAPAPTLMIWHVFPLLPSLPSLPGRDHTRYEKRPPRVSEAAVPYFFVRQ
jgi:hypothetical protein